MKNRLEGPAMAQFVGFRCQGNEVLNPDTLYETAFCRLG